ncbi:hypothetical protein OTU49_003029 [Cherax quadricarinatus]|uniref:Enolase-phosphatase E1 n=1 Tax=Cherax quadricarinatus TaxID=27406 RepID=A0AAW0X6F2_CHEQU
MKRRQEDFANLVNEVDIIMLDIEGTTTSISFVKEELFPYVRQEISNYLKETWDTQLTKDDVAALTRQVSEDARAGVEPLPTSHSPEVLIPALVATVAAMMDADSKVPALKALQGHMWHRAYLNGAITGQSESSRGGGYEGSGVSEGGHSASLTTRSGALPCHPLLHSPPESTPLTQQACK